MICAYYLFCEFGSESILKFKGLILRNFDYYCNTLHPDRELLTGSPTFTWVGLIIEFSAFYS